MSWVTTMVVSSALSCVLVRCHIIMLAHARSLLMTLLGWWTIYASTTSLAVFAAFICTISNESLATTILIPTLCRSTFPRHAAQLRESTLPTDQTVSAAAWPTSSSRRLMAPPRPLPSSTASLSTESQSEFVYPELFVDEYILTWTRLRSFSTLPRHQLSVLQRA